MKKTFAEILNGLDQSSRSVNFDSSSRGVQKKFDVVHLNACEFFLSSLDKRCRDKIEDTIDIARSTNDPRLLKKLSDTIWEFRIRWQSVQYRLLAFWDKKDERSVVLTTHGFIKKTDKVPRRELLRANWIRSNLHDQKSIKMITDEELKDKLMGKIGTPERDRFEIKRLMWDVGYGIKMRRRELSLSFEELAQRSQLTIKEIKGIERGNVTTHIPNIHRIWLELGIYFKPGDRMYDDNHASKAKSQSRKRTVTKQSRPLRTLVR